MATSLKKLVALVIEKYRTMESGRYGSSLSLLRSNKSPILESLIYDGNGNDKNLSDEEIAKAIFELKKRNDIGTGKLASCVEVLDIVAYASLNNDFNNKVNNATVRLEQGKRANFDESNVKLTQPSNTQVINPSITPAEFDNLKIQSTITKTVKQAPAGKKSKNIYKGVYNTNVSEQNHLSTFSFTKAFQKEIIPAALAYIQTRELILKNNAQQQDADALHKANQAQAADIAYRDHLKMRNEEAIRRSKDLRDQQARAAEEAAKAGLQIAANETPKVDLSTAEAKKAFNDKAKELTTRDAEVLKLVNKNTLGREYIQKKARELQLKKVNTPAPAVVSTVERDERAKQEALKSEAAHNLSHRKSQIIKEQAAIIKAQQERIQRLAKLAVTHRKQAHKSAVIQRKMEVQAAKTIDSQDTTIKDQSRAIAELSTELFETKASLDNVTQRKAQSVANYRALLKQKEQETRQKVSEHGAAVAQFEAPVVDVLALQERVAIFEMIAKEALVERDALATECDALLADNKTLVRQYDEQVQMTEELNARLKDLEASEEESLDLELGSDSESLSEDSDEEATVNTKPAVATTRQTQLRDSFSMWKSRTPLRTVPEQAVEVFDLSSESDSDSDLENESRVAQTPLLRG